MNQWGKWTLTNDSEQLQLENLPRCSIFNDFITEGYPTACIEIEARDGMSCLSTNVPIIALKAFIARWEELNGPAEKPNWAKTSVPFV